MLLLQRYTTCKYWIIASAGTTTRMICHVAIAVTMTMPKMSKINARTKPKQNGISRSNTLISTDAYASRPKQYNHSFRDPKQNKSIHTHEKSCYIMEYMFHYPIKDSSRGCRIEERHGCLHHSIHEAIEKRF